MRVSELIFFKLNKKYHDVKCKNSLYCVIHDTRDTIIEFIEDYLLNTNLKRIYYREFDVIDIYEDFLSFLVEKKPRIIDDRLMRIRGSFSGCLQTFLNRRLNPLKKRNGPRIRKEQPELVQIQNCWNEVSRVEDKAEKYSFIDEIVENEVEKLYEDCNYPHGNYLDYNSAIFVAMFLGVFDIEYKESLMYFPYNYKEYMINALSCKFIDIAHRVERRI